MNGFARCAAHVTPRSIRPGCICGLRKRVTFPIAVGPIGRPIMKPRQPKKLMLAGDWHGNLPWAFKALNCAKYQGADTVLHVGDFGFWRDTYATQQYLTEVQRECEALGLLLYWVDGNHEDHGRLEGLGAHDVGAEPWCLGHLDRIVHLPRGYRWEWWGDTWMALGGAASIDQSFRVEGEGWWPGEFLREAQAKYAMRSGQVDIIVAHDAPAAAQIPGINPGKDLWLQVSGLRRKVPDWVMANAQLHREVVQNVCDAVKPKEFYHGHYHKAYEALARLRGGAYMSVRGLDKDDTSMDANTHFITSGLEDDSDD